MSYQDSNEQYRDMGQRGRYEMCAREQGYVFAADGRPDIAALGRGVVAGNMTDLDALIAGVVVGPNGDQLDDDAALLSAMQAIWPTVAAARYPQ